MTDKLEKESLGSVHGGELGGRELAMGRNRYKPLQTQILCPEHKNVSDFVQKNFVSATNVSHFAQPKKHHG